MQRYKNNKNNLNEMVNIIKTSNILSNIFKA